MNLSDPKYARYSLVREMLESARVVRELPLEPILALARVAKGTRRTLLTGEGSSRIFPAKLSLYNALRNRYDAHYFTEAATQALEYDLRDAAVFIASNSGRTKEGVRLLRSLKGEGHRRVIGVVANAGTPIEREADARYLLSCGPERAVAATKSVIEQALFYDLLFRKRHRKPLPDLARLAELLQSAMEAPIPAEITERLAAAETLYWAGRNNGVAEELTLKTNEITHKRSDFLEGTYAVHGIEEVMKKGDALVIVDPFLPEEGKFHEALESGVGLALFALTSGRSRFPSISVPSYGEFTPYIQLAAGWSLLVEIGVRLGIDLDKAERARKVGNELKE